MGSRSAAVVVAFGAFTLAAQTVLFREYLVACNGGEIAVGLFYASWFLWIAVGALAHRWLPRRQGDEVRRLLALVALYLPAAAVQMAALRSLRALAGVPAADVFPVDTLAWITLATNAPVGLITGMTFPVVCALAARGHAGDEPGRAATRGYILESVGSFAGGLVATLLVLLAVSPVGVFSAAALALTGAAVALAVRRQAWRLTTVLALEAALALALLATPLGARLEGAAEGRRFAHAVPGIEHLISVDTPYRHLALGRHGTQLVALSDGTPLAALPARDADVPTAALLAAQRPGAETILVIGQGAEGLVAELLGYRPGRLIHLQPDERAARALEPHLPPALAGSLGDPALERAFGDPRRFLREFAAGRDRVDLVVLAVGDPTTASANRLATREFHGLCEAALADDGVLATRISSTVNYLGQASASYGASALLTLRDTFDEVALLPGETTWLVAGAAGVPTADPGELARRYRTLPTTRRAVPADTFANLVDPRRVASVTATYEEAARGRERALRNRDARPVTYLLQLGVLAGAGGAGIADALPAFRRGGVWLFVIPLLVAGAVALRRTLLWPEPGAERRRAGPLLLGLAGAAAIALQVCLILSFQTRFGDLFAQVGWLNALFMAGLAGGAAVGNRWARRGGTRAATAFCGAAIALCLVASRAMPWLQAAEGDWAGIVYYLLILAGGGVFGAGFPVAGALVSRAGDGAGRVGALLESADHWGAAAGAALVGVAMVPLLGPSRTALVLGFALAVAAVVIALPDRLRRHGATSPALGDWLDRLARRGGRRAPAGRAVGGVLGGIAVAAIAVAAVVRAGDEGPRIRFDPDELAGMTPDLGLVEVEEPFVHYRGVDADGQPVGDVLCASRAISDDIEGYGGPLDLLVALTPDGAIRDLRLVASRETPAYLVGFDDWLREVRDLPLSAPIAPADGEPIEGLTGATLTSVAALATVDRVRREVAREVLDLEPPPTGATPAPWTRLPVLVLGCLLLAAVPTLLSGQRWVRVALLVLSTLLTGLWLNQQLSLEHLVPLAHLELPSLANTEGLLLLGGALLLGIAFGPAYCGVLCPLGAAQELLSSFGLTTRPSAGAGRAARSLKYGLLVATLLVFLASGSHTWLSYDPLGARLGLRAAGPLLALVVLALGASLRYPRFWCRALCPVGAALSLTNRLALLRRFLPPRRYDRCDLGVRSAGDWDCIQCNRCGWVGPTAPSAPDAPGEPVGPRRSADRWLALLLALSLALIAATVFAARPLPAADSSRTRPADVDRIRQRIESRELSDHPAEFWEPVDGTSGCRACRSRTR